MARLLTQKWDAFVFLSPEASGVRDVSPDLLPFEQQYTLLKAVTEGAGLVLIGADDKRVLKERNQFQQMLYGCWLPTSSTVSWKPGPPAAT